MKTGYLILLLSGSLLMGGCKKEIPEPANHMNEKGSVSTRDHGAPTVFVYGPQDHTAFRIGQTVKISGYAFDKDGLEGGRIRIIDLMGNVYHQAQIQTGQMVHMEFSHAWRINVQRETHMVLLIAFRDMQGNQTLIKRSFVVKIPMEDEVEDMGAEAER